MVAAGKGGKSVGEGGDQGEKAVLEGTLFAFL